jgi:hypothetical protein
MVLRGLVDTAQNKHKTYLGTLVHELQSLGPALDDLVWGKGERLVESVCL